MTEVKAAADKSGEVEEPECPCEVANTGLTWDRDRASRLCMMRKGSAHHPATGRLPSAAQCHFSVTLVADLGMVSSGQAWASPLAAFSLHLAKRLMLERAQRPSCCLMSAGQGSGIQGVAQGCPYGASV